MSSDSKLVFGLGFQETKDFTGTSNDFCLVRDQFRRLQRRQTLCLLCGACFSLLFAFVFSDSDLIHTEIMCMLLEVKEP